MASELIVTSEVFIFVYRITRTVAPRGSLTRANETCGQFSAGLQTRAEKGFSGEFVQYVWRMSLPNHPFWVSF